MTRLPTIATLKAGVHRVWGRGAWSSKTWDGGVSVGARMSPDDSHPAIVTFGAEKEELLARLLRSLPSAPAPKKKRGRK